MNDLFFHANLSAEVERMEAVRRYDILDTPPDGSFDRITAMAARRFGVPISILTIVDESRIWFKSHYGLTINQIDRDEGLCATTIMSAFPRVLNDAKEDNCALTNPLVAGDFGLRFYAGVPLRTYDGFNLGTLCVVDAKPRSVSDAEIADLEDLASVAMDQLELRISARRAVARERMLAKEIDHRVMNSLQFISSMLSLQRYAPETQDDAAGALQRAANRVATVAQVHRNFLACDAGAVDCLGFLRRLCGELAQILGIVVNVSGDDGPVDSRFIQPVGLIASELVTNAGKYGEGDVAVSFRFERGARVLTVCNGGPGLPADFDPARTTGMGMRLITSLVREQHGHFSFSPRDDGTGVCFQAVFPG
jgi:two-component sensor histidine kinase